MAVTNKEAQNAKDAFDMKMLTPISDTALGSVDVNRWDEKAGLQAGCGVRSQVIDVLEAQEIKETGNEEG